MQDSPCVKHRKASGVSMTEYGLCAGLCVLVAIPALSYLGGGLDNHFTHMLGSPPSVTEVGSLSVHVDPPNSKSTTGQTTALSFSIDGHEIVLPNVPTNIASSIQTAGANGTTQLLSDQLISLANQLLAAGKVTQEQADSLIYLANRGHNLADLQESVELGLEVREKDDASVRTPVTLTTREFQGPTDKTGREVTRTYSNVYAAAANMDVEVSGSASSRLLAFQNAWDTAKGSGALTDPNVKAIVNQLAGNIYNLSADFSAAVAKVPKNQVSNVSETVMKAVVNKQIHENAGGICDFGNGKDTGIHCSEPRS